MRSGGEKQVDIILLSFQPPIGDHPLSVPAAEKSLFGKTSDSAGDEFVPISGKQRTTSCTTVTPAGVGDIRLLPGSPRITPTHFIGSMPMK